MKKIFRILIGATTIIAILLGLVYCSGGNQNLEVYFFNVGQGDGILIKTPSNQNIVIDGGPDNTLITKLGQALPFYDRTIDLMVLTHPHEDHLFGLIEVLKRYQVKQVLYSGVVFQNNSYQEWLKQIEQKKIVLKTAQAGQRYFFNDVELKVLFPIKNYAGRIINEKNAEGAFNDGLQNLNNTSVVLLLRHKEVKILFMGDLEAPGEEEILNFFSEELSSQVIKIGHHGSMSACSQKFLAAVRPEYAVIQVGPANKFNLPNGWVLARLKRLKTLILRTDLLGDLKLNVNDSGFKIRPCF